MGLIAGWFLIYHVYCCVAVPVCIRLCCNAGNFHYVLLLPQRSTSGRYVFTSQDKIMIAC